MATILIIEDMPTIQENIAQALQLADFEVLRASAGLQGIQLARQHLPDLIISDISLPDLDGYHVLEELRADTYTASIPFIFLTGNTDRTAMRKGMECGADDFLTKPFSAPELIGAVNARFERQAAVARKYDMELETARKEFTRMVTHELRTPLISIATVQDIISRQIGHLSQNDLQELLATLGSGSRRLGHVVEQMVLIVQLDSGLLKRDMVFADGSSTQLWQLMTGATNLARRFAYRQPDVSIRLVEHNREAVVIAVPQALKHALAELITNALNFSSLNGEVIVSYWQANGWVWLTIEDSGPGMSPEQIKRALQEFQQPGREIQEQQGIGLGLPLARRIIEVHGGRLGMKSVVGKGTQVQVKLPAQ